jgi:hypothetical protein
MHSQVSERRFDLSRDTFDATKLYRQIIKQQGRVTVDADDNEQRRIELHRSDRTTLDIIGECGYPAGGTGFLIGVSADAMSLTVGTGRMYVHGLMVENFTTTPQLVLDSTTAGAPPSLAPVTVSGTYLAYLDVWERDITAIDDPNIREVALGGPDTAARTELMAQVHLTAVASGTTCATATLPSATLHTGTLTATTDPAAAALDCTLPPLAGFRGQQNQLYRVEIQDGGAVGTATFKWSRENGSVVSAITGPASGPVGSSFTVASVGADSTLGFANGQWIELIDDDLVLTGQPGALALISTVTPSTLTVTLTSTSPTGVISYGKNPKIRRWEQADPTATTGLLTTSTATQLENGVQVAFGGGSFSPGDYWMIPARTAIDEETGTLLYPATAQAASYTEHHLCELAVITYDSTAGWGAPSDCRTSFPTLTGLPAAGGCCCSTVTVVDANPGSGQYTDIGAAIAALPVDGGVVSIEAGIYTIASPITVPASVTVRGCGLLTRIIADTGAFIVAGDNVTIEGMAIRISHAAAVATASSGVTALILRGLSVIGHKTSDDAGAGAYAFSFAGTNAMVFNNTLRSVGIEVQPGSSSVTIRANTIAHAVERGISLGSSIAAAAATSQTKAYYYGVAGPGLSAQTGATLENLQAGAISNLGIFENSITGAFLEGIGAEMMVQQQDGNQNPISTLILCEDVTIARNQIAGCLARPEKHNVGASGAIVLPFVERLVVVGNTIEGNGRSIPASGICSLIAAATEIRENRILENGAGAGSGVNYGLAAIELFIAIPTGAFESTIADNALLPAAIISDNVVTSSNAAALFMLADGQVSITDNDFTVVGQSQNELAIGQTVMVLDFGVGHQETTFTLFDETATQYSSDEDVIGGQVLFTGNRCLYDGRDTGVDAYSSVILVSEDAVLIDANQSRCFVLASSPSGQAGMLVTNLLAGGVVTQVSGNRFSEDAAGASAFATGGDTMAIGNHGTHCLFFNATGTLTDEPNIVNPLNADYCDVLRPRLWGNPNEGTTTGESSPGSTGGTDTTLCGLQSISAEMDKVKLKALEPAARYAQLKLSALKSGQSSSDRTANLVQSIATTRAALNNPAPVSPETFVVHGAIVDENGKPRTDCSLAVTDAGTVVSSKLGPQKANTDGYATAVLRAAEFPSVIDGTTPIFVSVTDGEGRQVFAPAKAVTAKPGGVATFRAVVPRTPAG